MEDLERYGDYNEYDDDAPKSKNTVVIILKVLLFAVCFGVIGFFAFRIILFNYYPDSMEKIYFTENLTAYYNENGGEIGAETQKMRAPYDDPDKGRFFCDNLIIIRGANEIQVSLRLNSAVIDDLNEEFGLSLDAENAESFSFSLSYSNMGKQLHIPIGSLTYCEKDSLLMYHYYKLVFGGVDLDLGGEGKVEWLSLEIRPSGADIKEPYRVLIYENIEDYCLFEEYELSDEEHP